ncbi:MAG: hypothetical protein OMM_08387 [Candidatus Magnetoglobus multicellularis str. Araruama]|uniref:Uncharacterized protein n=1 Tax=Candidatus Magnetoglobus multicellularis str. Araruama TaxID=890399 RepID=A0A1V1P812_9BACT|nr:MAG: hypothetical protein OMM_08387 [Candidatus Magnetoglobus multicellularis str. Araruama]
MNATHPIALEKPIYEYHQKNFKTKTYHVKGIFKATLNFRMYPFDPFRAIMLPKKYNYLNLYIICIKKAKIFIYNNIKVLSIYSLFVQNIGNIISC